VRRIRKLKRLIRALLGLPVGGPFKLSDRAWLMPVVGGADDEHEADCDGNHAEGEPCNEEAKADPEPAPEPTPDPEPDPDPDDEDEPFDKDRAMRTIRRQREEEKKLKARADAAEKERDELRQAQESEQERTVRERDEAKAEAALEKQAALKAQVDLAIYETALEAGIPGKKVKRTMRLIDRDGITLEDGEVQGVEDALTDLLNDVPELKGEPTPDPEPEPEGDPEEEPGGNPDRRRKPREMTPERAAKLAKDDPVKFNELFEEGKIPASALGKK
jgi:hypothetical protein